MHRGIRIILLGLITGLVACGDAGSSRTATPTAAPPGYRVVVTRDVSMGAVRRFQVKVSLPEHYSRDVVETVAKAVVADTTKMQPVNALSILFYGPGTSTDGVYDVAMVEWAPEGQWGEAGSVRTGEYGTFRYAVSYKTPEPTPVASSRLTAADRKGLLGVPLPVGAQLTKQTPGDPASGRDPSERYSVSASAVELVAFFADAMPTAGWAKDGSSTNTTLFFRKGRLMIGVVINSGGGTFTLMGS
jgi:hypothetical protein